MEDRADGDSDGPGVGDLPAPGTRVRAVAAAAGAGTADQAYLVVRVASERFAIPLQMVLEGLEEAELTRPPGVGGRWLGLVGWRGRQLPLATARVVFGRAASFAGQAVVVLAGERTPLALAVDDLCEVRTLPSRLQRPFRGREDSLGVVRAVVWDREGLIAVVDGAALRAVLEGASGHDGSLYGAEEEGRAAPGVAARAAAGGARGADGARAVG